MACIYVKSTFLLFEAGILTCIFCLQQAMIENTKTELQQKINKRKTQVVEINASLKSCTVSCVSVKHCWIDLE